ncbi:hypothetical protein DMB66_01435 [Actinoplanes sp. ATCC 53533]|uniref:hypothetical protein n=1 Tax=Actinoplanes sp. ATCC 53533 TaxID=1288362 RepID=UPI000F791EFE|nr:hypothetical protein [Actinoplanes sp. ATCC 53533]RSM74122.1 hypothetical protein DMB66_01435 [Actinoplanes sp. ATCC 53533]
MRSYLELSEHELRTRLGSIAAGHQPDRTAMLNRIAQHRADAPVADRRRAGQAWRLAGSALAVATILGVGGVARWALADGPGPTVGPVAPPAATRTAPTPARTTAAPTPPAARSVAPAPRTSPAQAAPESAGKGQRALWSDGSIDPDSGDTAGRSDITVKVREPVRALELTVRVALTPGLTDQGAVHDVTGARIDTTVVRERDALVYRFELAGGTLAEGTYVFAAKYAYEDGGRDAGDDTYRVRATTADRGAELELRGDFY